MKSYFHFVYLHEHFTILIINYKWIILGQFVVIIIILWHKYESKTACYCDALMVIIFDRYYREKKADVFFDENIPTYSHCKIDSYLNNKTMAKLS